MTPGPTVQVRIASRGIREALEKRLKLTNGVGDALVARTAPRPGDIIIMMASETSPFECLGIREAGFLPLVLASFWSDRDNERYACVGVLSYMQLELPPDALISIIANHLAVS